MPRPSQIAAAFRCHVRWFAIWTVVALALHAFFFWKFRTISDDGFLYGDIARNWLQYGVFGLTTRDVPVPTYIRLPGYPAFLALIFRVFGMEHYTAVLVTQILADVATCFVVADLARRVIGDRAARWAFALTAICPFLANYAVVPLTETLAVFFAALALDFAVIALDDLTAGRLRYWIACGLAVAASILLRPDGGILLAAIGGYLLYLFFFRAQVRRQAFWAGLVLAAVSLAPLLPWTARNWHVFHRFMPLAPRYANGPNERVPMGYETWMKTWIVDYVSTAEIYWQIGAGDIDTSLLPTRAFDSAQERDATQTIFDAYNQKHVWSDQLDARLGQIAKQRIAHAPLRYYIWLPAIRAADMWFRPRTELVGTNDRWWEFQDDPEGTAVGIGFGVLNLIYVALAVIGLIAAHRRFRWLGLLLAFVLLRSLFLGTLENPEPRYTLECFPVMLVFAGTALALVGTRRASAKASQQSATA
jgi:4-amino-4-deoxy-L-arabinose transferase-like glycosyltransferase